MLLALGGVSCTGLAIMDDIDCWFGDTRLQRFLGSNYFDRAKIEKILSKKKKKIDTIQFIASDENV